MGLQLDVEGPRAHAAAVHWAEDLDVLDRIEAKTLRDALRNQLNDARYSLLWIRSRDEIEIRLPIWLAKIGQAARIDGMRRCDDLALGCLPENLGNLR